MGEDRIDLTPQPTVILVAGVNGTGKTTTVGKLAWHLGKELGQTVVVGAADTSAPPASSSSRCGPSGPGRVREGFPERRPGSVAFEGVRPGIETALTSSSSTPPGGWTPRTI